MLNKIKQLLWFIWTIIIPIFGLIFMVVGEAWPKTHFNTPLIIGIICWIGGGIGWIVIVNKT